MTEENKKHIGKASNQSVKILFVKDYLVKHTNSEHKATTKDIIDYLATQGIRADRKTIIADIQRLKYDYGMEIESTNRGYYIPEGQFEPYELRLLVDSVQSAKFITQKEATALTKKIKELGDVYTAPSLSDRKAFVDDRITRKDESIVLNTDKIYEAIALDNQISFRYFHYQPGIEKKKKYSKNGSLYTVSPFALYWNEGYYYLYAYLEEKERFQYFRIDRMENIFIPVALKREGNYLFKESQFTKKRKSKIFRMYGGEEFNVRLRFINRFADAVIDEFGKDVMLMPVDKNHFTVNVSVQISPTFFSWLTTFGKGVKIESPQNVIDLYVEFVNKIMELY